MSSPPPARTNKIQFAVSSISCVACTPAFRRELLRVAGIRAVSELPMLNAVVVEFDPSATDGAMVKKEIYRVAERAGYKGKVIMSRQGVS